MFKKITTYIEQEPWDEALERQMKRLDRACWLAIASAAFYFSPVLWHIFTR